MVINKVILKGSDMDNLYEAFDKMDYKAEDYTPTKEELKIILQDLKKYAAFLLWINDTGTVTEDNEEEHAIIETIIKNYIDTDQNN